MICEVEGLELRVSCTLRKRNCLGLALIQPGM